jgi:hypothetical protein
MLASAAVPFARPVACYSAAQSLLSRRARCLAKGRTRASGDSGGGQRGQRKAEERVQPPVCLPAALLLVSLSGQLLCTLCRRKEKGPGEGCRLELPSRVHAQCCALAVDQCLFAPSARSLVPRSIAPLPVACPACPKGPRQERRDPPRVSPDRAEHSRTEQGGSTDRKGQAAVPSVLRVTRLARVAAPRVRFPLAPTDWSPQRCWTRLSLQQKA